MIKFNKGDLVRIWNTWEEQGTIEYTGVAVITDTPTCTEEGEVAVWEFTALTPQGMLDIKWSRVDREEWGQHLEVVG